MCLLRTHRLVLTGCQLDRHRAVLIAALADDAHAGWRSATAGRGFAAGAPTMPDAEAESGRGLAFLDALADRWGVVSNGETCVWFELDL